MSTPASASNTARQIAEVVLTRFTQQADSRAVKVLEGYRLDNLLLELNETSKIAFGAAELRLFG